MGELRQITQTSSGKTKGRQEIYKSRDCQRDEPILWNGFQAIESHEINTTMSDVDSDSGDGRKRGRSGLLSVLGSLLRCRRQSSCKRDAWVRVKGLVTFSARALSWAPLLYCHPD